MLSPYESSSDSNKEIGDVPVSLTSLELQARFGDVKWDAKPWPVDFEGIERYEAWEKLKGMG